MSAGAFGSKGAQTLSVIPAKPLMPSGTGAGIYKQVGGLLLLTVRVVLTSEPTASCFVALLHSNLAFFIAYVLGKRYDGVHMMRGATSERS